MFQIIKETDYAIQFLNLLAKSKNKKALSLNEVAKKTGISFLFLQKIARKLRYAGLIKAAQGVNGGYALAVPAKSLNLRTVLETIEGGCSLTECTGNNNKCPHAEKCTTRGKMSKLNKEVVKVLEKVKISNI